ncbi:hypothetical protein BV22DRAFT_1196461 [Leucogyrophana mollusca]|uniref:Uncharacterized protein n=1 Tax=Leucogyrophana mollusca TaxID=85980 RepID=A0ACB8BER7_9AGAM|nr:hypothetical protein BV22DRAFT_1196461 [Leucogyrophana mollusca]
MEEGRTLRKANPKTIQDKFLVGYQGWFTCAGDGEPVGPGHHGWLHWFNYPVPDGGRPNTDLWPDVSEYSPSELYPAPGLKYANGDQVFLFSSRHPKTVRRHFHWMALHGVDGAFLQRFAGQCDVEAGNEGILRIRDEVGDQVREAAEQEGRVFAIMYDVSGVSPDRIQRVLERDWVHLMRDKCLLDSPNYLREKGKPVVALWGFGFNDRNHSPAVVRAIVSFFRSATPGGVYIVAGTPAHWRTSVSDADRNPEFVDVWLNEFDAICPWTVGRYGNEDDADRFAEEKIKGDVDLLKKRAEEGGKKVDYMPVILPGGSGYNLSEGKWGFNDIKRNGGRFLWKQIFNARRAGVRTIYGAMWDEYDEGTAYMPVVPNKSMLPVHDKYQFMALDEDGYDLPSDWYMRICGFAGEALRGERRLHETFPVKELQDYWGTRPRYEEKEEKPPAEEAEKAYREWMATQAPKEADEVPPPPYSLEAEQQPQQQPTTTSAGPSGSVSSVRPLPAPSEVRSPSATVVMPPMSSRPSPSAPSARPPSVDKSSRPPISLPVEANIRPPSTSPLPASSSRVSSPHHSVNSLADDFSRQRISTSQTPHPPPPRLSSKPILEVPTGDMKRAPSPMSTPGPSLPPHTSSHHPPPVSHTTRPSLSPQPNPGQMSQSSHRPPDHSMYGASAMPSPTLEWPLRPPHGPPAHYDPQFDYQRNNIYPQPQQWGGWAPPSSPPAGYPFNYPYSPGSPNHGPPHHPSPPPHFGPQGPPPAVPPRPYGGSMPSPPLHPQYPNYVPYQQPGPQPFNGGGGGFAGRARSAVDGVVGQETRRQLEKSVESLAQTGSKLLNKFK